MKKLLSFFGYKTVWLSGVVGASFLQSLTAPILCIFYVSWYLKQHSFKKVFIRYLFFTTCIGILIEMVLFQSLIYSFSGPPLIFGSVPLWLIAIWVAFPCMCEMSLKKVLLNPYFCSIFGLFLCPLPYVGAAKMGVIVLRFDSFSFLTLSLAWLMIMLFIRKMLKGLPDSN